MSRAGGTGRRRGREAALQMLYQWEVGRSSADEAIATYWPAHDPENEIDEPLRDFANALVRGTIARVAEIDAILAAHAQNWRIERMAATLRRARHRPALSAYWSKKVLAHCQWLSLAP